MQARCKRNSLSSALLGGLGVVVAVGVSAVPVQARTVHGHVASSHHHRVHLAVASHRRSSGSAHASASGSSDIVAEARRWLGGNPTRRRSLWCAAFMNFVLERTGHHGTGSDLARSFASYGHRVSGPRVGAIAVMSRKGGGHVGVVSGIDTAGNPIIISGNNRNSVREAAYHGARIYAYVVP